MNTEMKTSRMCQGHCSSCSWKLQKQNANSIPLRVFWGMWSSQQEDRAMQTQEDDILEKWWRRKTNRKLV